MRVFQAVIVAGVTAFAGCWVASVQAEPFTGWETMRVIRLEGNPNQLRTGDITRDGRDELIVINTRQARLDLYRWLTPDEREAEEASDPDRPNELPMAPELSHEEISLDSLPRDVVIEDLDADGKAELIVLAAPPNRVLIYKMDDEGKWQKRESFDLLAGEYQGVDRLMLLRKVGNSHEVLVSCAEGIQTLELKRGSRATWMQPRERVARMKWWLGDLDGDGDADLVEWTRQPRQTVRWYEAVDNHRLLPAQVVYDAEAAAVEALIDGDGRMEMLLLGGLQDGLLRRYRVGVSEPTPLGRMQTLPVSNAMKAVWTGVTLGGQPALVLVDSAQPRLLAYMLTDAGWQLRGDGFPIVTKVQAIAAPQAQPGTVLMWARDATDLHMSRWEDGRLTYPQLMPQSADESDRSILALATTGRTTWWVQKVGKDLDLYVWEPDSAEPQRTRFAGVGEKADRIAWLGGAKLLVMDKHARSPKYIRLDAEGKAIVAEPSHLRQAKLEDFAVYGESAYRRVGMISEGVLQWLDDELNPIDQIMLPEGEALASYVPIDNDGGAWALASGGQFIHKLAHDDSGLPRIVESHRIHFGTAALADPVLGLMLLDNERIIRASAGQPRELSLQDSLDGRVGRRSGVREATIHRVMTSDVTGDGGEDVIIADDRRHHLTVLVRGEEKMEPRIAWQVFDDLAYPYGGGQGQQQFTPEPRVVMGLDLDGDGARDLALLCHDRLIFYVGRQEKQE